MEVLMKKDITLLNKSLFNALGLHLGNRFCNYFCCWPLLGLSYKRQYIMNKRVSCIRL